MTISPATYDSRLGPELLKFIADIDKLDTPDDVLNPTCTP
jgi:hypothetical protein